MSRVIKLLLLTLAVGCSTLWAEFPSRFSTLESFGLRPTVIRYPSICQGAEPLYDLNFKKISEAQYLRVKELFLNKTQVPYSAEREYTLVDFLPPQMQALYGLNFRTQYCELKGLRNFLYDTPLDKEDFTTITTSAYCYGTAWNNVVALQSNSLASFYFGHVKPSVAEKYLFSDDYGRRLGNHEKLAFGDLIPIYQVWTVDYREIVHTPMYLVDGIVFEKEDSSSRTGFRIVGLDDTIKGTAEEVSERYRRKILVTKRRLLGHEKNLPPISEVGVYRGPKVLQVFGPEYVDRLTKTEYLNMGGGTVRTVELLMEIPFTVDSAGRGQLIKRDHFSPGYVGVSCHQGLLEASARKVQLQERPQ